MAAPWENTTPRCSLARQLEGCLRHAIRGDDFATHRAASPVWRATDIDRYAKRGLPPPPPLRAAIPLIPAREQRPLQSSSPTPSSAASSAELQFACIRAPASMPDAVQEALFARYLPLTLDAFGETLDTVTAKSRGEHKDHMFGGDVLVLAGVVVGAEFRLVGHCLVRCFSSDEDQAIMHIKGVIADTEARGLGIARALVEACAAVIQPRYITARTANVAIANLLWSMRRGQETTTRRTGQRGPLWPLSAYLLPIDDKEEEEGGKQLLRRPVDIPDEALRVGRLVAAAMEEDLEAYDAPRMAYRGVYPPDRRSVFTNAAAPNVAATEVTGADLLRRAVRVAEGDAALLLLPC